MLSVKNLKNTTPVEVEVYGHKLTFHVRTAKTRELLEINRVASSLSADLEAGNEARLQQFVDCASALAHFIDSVEGLEEEWSELTDEQRLDVFETIHIADFWSVFAAITPRLEEEEKNE